MKIFIENLKNLILQSEKPQIEICKEMKISKQKLTNWKSGYTEPNLNDLISLANYFQCSIDYLLGIEDDFGVRTGEPISDMYSPEEHEIIKKYRELNAPGKKLIKQTLDTLHSSSEQSQKKKA